MQTLKLNSSVEERNVNDLEAHELNNKIYGSETIPKDFINSVRNNGILVPIVIKPDGTIMSGHRRWQVAKMVGMDVVPVVVQQFHNVLAEHEAVISYNRQREKTFSQKMAEAEELEAIEKERAENRILAGKVIEPSGNISLGSKVQTKGQTRDKVAEKVGIGSGRTYDKAKLVWEKAKEDDTAKKMVEKIDRGKMSVNAAYRDIKRIQKKEEIYRVDPGVLQGKYNVIYADPPWQYDINNTSIRGTAEDHYPTMAIDEIMGMPVKDITLADAVLFLWTTNSMLKKAFYVIDAWGFEFKTSMAWIKNHIGTGYYVRSKHELLLIGIKGSFRPMTTDLPESVIVAGKEAHSKKPKKIYDVIEHMYPGQRYIELFARERRDGWNSWGNEC